MTAELLPSAPARDDTPDTRGRADFHNRWASLGAPLRPPPQVIDVMRPWLADVRGTALQLGVTPEIAHLPARSVAADWDAAMIRLAWPGDDARHRALLADWLALPLGDASVACAFGDGCLSVLDWPDEAVRLTASLGRVLRRPARIVLRCFVRPDTDEAIEALVARAHLLRAEGFAAFKLRFNMAVVGATERVSNQGAAIHDLFERHVPDRVALAHATGWSRAEIDTIDAYAGSPAWHAYPTRAEIAAILPPASTHRFVETAGYALAERCPILVAEFVA